MILQDYEIFYDFWRFEPWTKMLNDIANNGQDRNHSIINVVS